MSLPPAVDLFSQARAPVLPTPPQPKTAPALPGGVPAGETLGGVLSAVLRNDPNIRKQMTPAEQAAVEAVVKNVGTPDEYGSAMEYVLRALPYVKSVYGAMDVVQPVMPTNEEIAILMRSRYL